MRRAGTGRLSAGEHVTWTVADGSRGRRWREVVTDGRGVRHALLFETGPDRRFAHLELATPAGLLTLHPEGGGSLHGNVVDAAGVRHVVGLPWDPDGLIELESSAVTPAAGAWLLDAGGSGPGTARRRAVTLLRIAAGLGLEVHRAAVERAWDGSWGVAGAARFVADADGLPVLEDASSWPLELAE